ncbi:protein of unknown function [Cupriavidus taiwanensis]|uniref:Uncharacterized protein n=1 Tax=Cupriavidus taiwanensis TaxID=164546 RepID=A0A7Z7J8D9_9BURK|nr:protein of unknown function [Cupriavidus taiwanensis]SOZ07767.1 hypothetical protein CBM2597_A90373 [Cupriavidus taiwanensis]SPC15802.1 hypothetical protein CBM2594_A70367 [Cupriavidus taiwanensis]SPD40467.1 protein of unknown function [Cupriavidus taiwanensis]
MLTICYQFADFQDRPPAHPASPGKTWEFGPANNAVILVQRFNSLKCLFSMAARVLPNRRGHEAGGVIECTYARRGAGRVPRARRIEAVRTAPGGRLAAHHPCTLRP